MKRDRGHAPEANLHSSVFLCRTGSALALLYGTSATLEHHHFNHAVMILQSEVSPCTCCVVLFWTTFFRINRLAPKAFRCTYSSCIIITQLNMPRYHAKAGITLKTQRNVEKAADNPLLHIRPGTSSHQKNHWNAARTVVEQNLSTGLWP